MATFEGSIQEFHHFLGPRIRNAINNYTRTYRKQRQTDIHSMQAGPAYPARNSERRSHAMAAALCRGNGGID